MIRHDFILDCAKDTPPDGNSVAACVVHDRFDVSGSVTVYLHQLQFADDLTDGGGGHGSAIYLHDGSAVLGVTSCVFGGGDNQNDGKLTHTLGHFLMNELWNL
jgi:hypothetical protein